MRFIALIALAGCASAWRPGLASPPPQGLSSVPTAAALAVSALATARSAAVPPSNLGATAVKVTDDAGRPVTLPAPARRIVSLSPHATELLFELGAGDRLAAVERNSDHPPEARARPQLAALPRPDLERVLSFVPDLVIVWGPAADADLITRFDRLGIPVFVSDPRSLEAIAVTIERFGELSGTGDRASARARALRERISALRRAHAGRPAVPVFVQIWGRPLMTLSDRDLIGDALRTCGARNVFGELAQAAAEVDPEAVLRRSPRLVLAFDDTDARRPWARLRVLEPEGRIAFRSVDRSLQRPTSRAVDALEQACLAIDRLRPTH
jgi:ABC-type Fe3+-hydroxamate transport system substrate-binding protein